MILLYVYIYTASTNFNNYVDTGGRNKTIPAKLKETYCIVCKYITV